MTIRKPLYILAVVALLGIGCKKDFLSPEQIDLVYNEVYWKSEKDAENAVLGAYALYRGLMVNAQMYNRGDVTTGYFNKGWNGGSDAAFYQPGDFANVNGTQKSWGAIESYADWNGFYKVIAHTNLVIDKLEGMPDNVFGEGSKNKLLGEAYFMRALTYYNIATIWGNAPLITESIESSSQVISPDNLLINVGRSQDTEITEQVLADAGRAAELLSYGTPGSAGWGIRANKGSAQALQGYANLWMAFLLHRDGGGGQENIAAAVAALESVVNNGNFSLAPYTNEAAVLNMYRGQSSEAVFELNISLDQKESYRADQGGIEALTSKLPPLDGDVTKDRANFINWVPANRKQFVYPEYPDDKRADLFWAAWSSTYNEPFSDVSPVSTDRNQVTWMKKFASFTVDPARQWNEYNAYFAEANLPVFRFTGIKLLLAEAYVKNNNAGAAKPIVDEIRNRAGLLPYDGPEMLEEILRQRTSELIGEGKIFFDYVRNNYWPFSSAMTPERYAQEGYYWPVSGNIITTNKLVTQTPYWNGKTIW